MNDLLNQVPKFKKQLFRLDLLIEQIESISKQQDKKMTYLLTKGDKTIAQTNCIETASDWRDMNRNNNYVEKSEHYAREQELDALTSNNEIKQHTLRKED